MEDKNNSLTKQIVHKLHVEKEPHQKYRKLRGKQAELHKGQVVVTKVGVQQLSW